MASSIQDLTGSGGLSTSGIQSIANSIESTIDTARSPASGLPPFYVTIEDMFRTGLSAISLTSNIVTRLGEAGIDATTLPDGTEPQITKMVRIMCEEIIKELQLHLKVVTEIPIGVTVGTGPTGPVVTAIPVQGAGIAY